MVPCNLHSYALHSIMLPLTGCKDEARKSVMRIRNQEAWLSQDFWFLLPVPKECTD